MLSQRSFQPRGKQSLAGWELVRMGHGYGKQIRAVVLAWGTALEMVCSIPLASHPPDLWEDLQKQSRSYQCVCVRSMMAPPEHP